MKYGPVATPHAFVFDRNRKLKYAGRIDDTENPYISPSNTDLSGAEVELVDREDREKALLNALNEVSSMYDYVIIDCPPSLGLLTINTLTAANSVIIPMQCEYYALEGLTALMNTISTTMIFNVLSD